MRKLPRNGLNRLLESVRAGHEGRQLLQHVIEGRAEEGPAEIYAGRDRAPEVGEWVDWIQQPPPDAPRETPDEETDRGAEEFPEIENLYRYVERTDRSPAFLAVDSIDALAKTYGISVASLAAALLEDLVETGHAAIVCVVERAGMSILDSLAVGTVSFSPVVRTSELEVVATVERMRGREVSQFRYSLRFRQNRLVADPTDAEIVDRLLGEGSFAKSSDLWPP